MHMNSSVFIYTYFSEGSILPNWGETPMQS